MTLNITVLTPTVIYQSADFRLINLDTGQPLTDRSAKTVMLRYWAWNGFITYTGIGRWRDKDISDLILEWLTGIEAPSMADVANTVATKGTELLHDVEHTYARRRHTFTLAGFEGDRALAYVISNFEDCFGGTSDTIADHLATTTRALRKERKATVIVTGQKSAVSLAERRVLGNVAARYPDESTRIRRRLETLNASAAASPRSGGSVSTECVVLSFRSEGTGVMQLNRDAIELPNQIPQIANGLNVGQSILNALTGLGVDPSQMRMVQATFASSQSARPVTESVTRCQYAIRNPGTSTEYNLIEITNPDFEPTSARDISDSGQVVGTGQLSHRPETTIPWSWRDSTVTRLNYSGSAISVNSAGQIAASLQVSPGIYRAAIYDNNAIIEFPLYHGQPGIFAGTDTAAAALNSQSAVAGEVRSQTEERGRPNTRAAVFRAGAPTTVLDALVADFGCRAVDINELGHVLINANPAIFDARSVLWNPPDNTWSYVGDETTNVFPIALNDEGVVLGQARNMHGHTISVICTPGGSWERLGTRDGWSPVDINNRGEVIGRARIDGLERPWLRRLSGEICLLPYISDHHTTPSAINNAGQIAGGANTDHGAHALVWDMQR